MSSDAEESSLGFGEMSGVAEFVKADVANDSTNQQGCGRRKY